MKNKKFMITGLIIVLVIGIVSVLAMANQDKSWYGHKDWKMSGKHSYKDFGDKGAWLEKMGLSSDATESQIIEAKKEHWEQGKADYMIKIREKLGLLDNASEEEVQEILQKWKEGKNFHKESWCDKS